MWYLFFGLLTLIPSARDRPFRQLADREARLNDEVGQGEEGESKSLLVIII